MTWAEEYRATTALNSKLAKTQIDHLKKTETRQQIAHEQAVALNAIVLHDNTLAVRREWQRHCVAVAIAQGLIARPYTVSTDVDLVKRSYDLAELMLQERERRK